MRRAVKYFGKRKRVLPVHSQDCMKCPGTSARSRQGHQRDELESKVVWHSTHDTGADVVLVRCPHGGLR